MHGKRPPVGVREDEAQIAEVLVRYATGIDQRNWTLFRSCWTPEIVADYGSFGLFTDRDSLTQAMANAHDPIAHGPSYHRMSNFDIRLDGDEAKVRSYVQAVLLLSRHDPNVWLDATGSYDDLFVRSEGTWRIRERLVRIGRTITSGAAPV